MPHAKNALKEEYTQPTGEFDLDDYGTESQVGDTNSKQRAPSKQKRR